MTIRHLLKVWQEYFPAFWDGTCTHSIRRLEDRTYAVGDEVTFAEFVPRELTDKPGRFTGRWIRGVITHVTEGGAIGSNVILPAALVVFTFRVNARSDGRELYRGQA